MRLNHEAAMAKAGPKGASDHALPCLLSSDFPGRLLSDGSRTGNAAAASPSRARDRTRLSSHPSGGEAGFIKKTRRFSRAPAAARFAQCHIFFACG